MLAGDLQQTLSRPAEVAISRGLALRTFGTEDAIGQSLMLKVYKDVFTQEGVYQEEIRQLFTITSIIDDRRPTIFHYNLLIGLSPSDIGVSHLQTSWYYNIVKLQPNTNLSRLKEKIEQDTLFASPSARFSFLPIQEVYYTRDFSDTELFRYRDYTQLQTGIYIALLVLLIACFNHVNINMTRSFQRLRYSVQQLIHGASKQEIRTQVIQETTLQVLFAFGVSLAIIYILLPTFNTFMESQLSLRDLFHPHTLLVLLFILASVILLPSIYIIVKLEKVSLSEILKKEALHHSRLVAGIVILQFSISIILLIFLTTIQRQMDYIVNLRPDSETIIDIRPSSQSMFNHWKTFKEQLITLPEIIEYTSTWPLENGAISEPGFSIHTLKMDRHFFHFYHTELIAGDSLYNSSANTGERVLVNETFVKKKNIDNPIGASVQINGIQYIISGVIRDYTIEHFSNEIQPLMIILDTAPWINSLGTVVKTRPGQTQAAIAKINQLWKEIAPDEQPAVINTLDEIYRDMHREEYRTTRIVTVFSWISLLLSCLGLFGLAWFSVESRTKEISLRKINGATESQIILLICGRFVKWILISSAIGIPIAIYLSRVWLTRFVYKVDLSPWCFILALLLVITIGIVTVIRQSWYAATRSPIDSLKTE